MKKANKEALIAILTEMFPLIVFVVVNRYSHFLWATIALIVSTPFAAYISYKIKDELPYISIFSVIFVTIFGILAIIFNDERFLTAKPTIVYISVAVVLLFSLVARFNIIRIFVGKKVHLPNRIWRNLTIYWALFFIVNAIINEYVRHATTLEQWFLFKSFIFVPVVVVFSGIITWWLMPHLKQGQEENKEN